MMDGNEVVVDMSKLRVGGRPVEDRGKYRVEDFSSDELDHFGTQVMWGIALGEVGASQKEAARLFNVWAKGRAKIIVGRDDVSYHSGTLETGIWGIWKVPGVEDRKRNTRS